MAEKETDRPPEKTVRTGKDKRGYIQYIGLATHKGITKEDWEAAGVTDQDTVWWTRANNYRVQRADLSDAAFNIGVRPDRFLVLIGGDPEEGSMESHPLADQPPAEQMPVMPDPNLYGR
jgi:hypothetical protein